MIFYQLLKTSGDEHEVLGYFPDLDSVHKFVKERVFGYLDSLGVAQVDVPVDKHSVLAMLNLSLKTGLRPINEHGAYSHNGLICYPVAIPTDRYWLFGPRGGLVQCTKDQL